MNPLPLAAISEHLAPIPGWQLLAERGGMIRREFEFSDFVTAFEFMSRMAAYSESAAHHPEWRNVYRRVEITLTTHDSHGLTAKDIAWAVCADQTAAALLR